MNNKSKEIATIEQATTEQKYKQELDNLTNLTEKQDTVEIARVLNLPEELVNFSLDCVGNGHRKGKIMVDGQMKKITHFSHMVRVAFLVQHFFPEDEAGKKIAILHDTKEEAIEGKEKKYKDSDLADEIDLLTEEDAIEEEIDVAREEIPRGFDPEYFATYRKYIARLNENWDKIGALELCDRLDGSSSFVYLMNEKYKDRMPCKALESFGRIWATINGKSGEVVDLIKDSCRKWFEKFNITEVEVEEVERMFLE